MNVFLILCIRSDSVDLIYFIVILKMGVILYENWVSLGHWNTYLSNYILKVRPEKVYINVSGLNALLCEFSVEHIWILPLFVAAVVSVGPQRDLTAAAAQAATGQPLFNQATVQAAQPNYIQYIPNYQVQHQEICCMQDIWYLMGVSLWFETDFHFYHFD